MGGMTRSKSAARLRVSYVDGAGAATNIAIAGIALTDEIFHVDHISTKASIATIVDISSEASITSAGQMQLASTATTSDLLRVFWLDNSPGPGDSQLKSMHNVQFTIIDGTTASTNIAVANSLTDDTILHVSLMDVKAAIEVMTDDTANCSFTSDGQIQSSTDTSGGQLLVIWNSNSGAVFQAESTFNMKISILAGSTAVNDIAVTGIVTADDILHCTHISTTASVATMADITSEVSITSAGNIQLSSTDTSSDTLWLVWRDTSEWTT